jgi:NTE family protein
MKKQMKRIFLLVLVSVATCVSSQAQTIDNLVFEGAGIRGIAYCGGLLELEERGMLKDVERVGGTSSGAITACLVSIGYSPKEIYEVIGDTDFGEFNDGRGIFIGGFHRLKKRMGYYKGEKFERWLESLLIKKVGSADITFQELKSRHQSSPESYKELVVTAMSLSQQKSLIIHAGTFPKMRIVDAVRASMAIPYYFEPVVIDENGKRKPFKEIQPTDHLCVDGGFMTNFPIYIFDYPPFCNGDFPADVRSCDAATLGLRIDPDSQIQMDKHNQVLAPMEIKEMKDYSVAFYTVIKESMNRYMLTESDWNRTVSISDCNIGPKVRKLDEKEKKVLIDAGRKSVAEKLDSQN